MSALVTHAANQKLGQWDFVPLNSTSIAKQLQTAGYRTAHYGKWHLGCTDDAPAVNSYGYDDSITYVSNINNSKQWGNTSHPNQPFDDRWFPANSSRLIIDHALRFLAAPASSTTSNQPFYLNLWFVITFPLSAPYPVELAGTLTVAPLRREPNLKVSHFARTHGSVP